MGVLLYQLAIFAIITVSSIIGWGTFITATIVCILFTLINVFVPWLMLIQLGTILFSISVGISIRRDNKKGGVVEATNINTDKNTSINEQVKIRKDKALPFKQAKTLIKVGMTMQDVESIILESPEKKVHTDIHQTWVYGENQYIFFENNKAKSVKLI